MEIFIYFIIFTLNLLLGFVLGYTKAKPETFQEVKQKIIKTEKPKLGVVKRPTAEQIRKRGTKEEETEAAMEETLDKVLGDENNSTN